jgi:hypothetical protein
VFTADGTGLAAILNKKVATTGFDAIAALDPATATTEQIATQLNTMLTALQTPTNA